MPKLSGFFNFVAKNRLRWLLVICSLGVLLDQASKIWAQSNLAESYQVSEEDATGTLVKKQIFYPIKVVEVIPNVFNLIYKENPAAAFSLTSSLPDGLRRPMLVSVSVFATILFLLWYFRMKANDGFLLFSFSLILAGAIGNLSDRIRLGYVIDFLDVHAGIFGLGHLHWPTFNIADGFIVMGAIGVIYRTLKAYKPATLTTK
jgi:signal peptidase II